MTEHGEVFMWSVCRVYRTEGCIQPLIKFCCVVTCRHLAIINEGDQTARLLTVDGGNHRLLLADPGGLFNISQM